MNSTRTLPYALLAPALIVVGAISFYPIFYAVDISLHRTEFMQKLAFVGLQNYWRLLESNDFLRAVVTSLKFALGSLLLTIPLGMLFALMLNRNIRFRAAFRTILFIPWTLSQSVTAMLWLWVLNPSFGPAKHILDQLGISQANFLSNPDWAMTIICLVNTWMSYPLPTVLFLAALQTVPKELYEAAHLDGCNTVQSFRHVTLPSIKATVMTTTIMVTLQFFNTVTLIYVLTGGGPLGNTRTLSLLVFLDGFFNFKVAAAAAVGMVIFALNVVFSLSYIRVLRQSHLE
ncbi:carbohydrate ABC transporter permease [Bosea sp. PAMC 26642]|uniref:carbohydrate ABC transporter permease n=1 Tax=Bosea sp. (strain PAMC 26642) TaxID=1792307 RepID=UPI0007703937|nr:sugar ABC transporter permease [Bosea sp. PAMC 26642]AMJ61563.1 hypothetical protein AXW83_15745 [Bosea sp. PAMC 26642]